MDLLQCRTRSCSPLQDTPKVFQHQRSCASTPPPHLISHFCILPNVCRFPGLPGPQFPNLLKGGDMLMTYTAPEVKTTWRMGGVHAGLLKPRSQKVGFVAAVVFTVRRDRQLPPPKSPGPGTLGHFSEGEAEAQSCGTNMLEMESRGRQNMRAEGWERIPGPPKSANSSQTHSWGVFLLAHEMILSQGYCFPWSLPLISQRKTACMITLMPPALPAACLPGRSPLLCPSSPSFRRL